MFSRSRRLQIELWKLWVFCGEGEEVWFIQIIISMLCFILTRDAIVIFSVWLLFSIVLLFMDHRQRKTSCYYWSISRKFFWAIRQPFPPSWIAAKPHCFGEWIRWTLVKKITSCHFGCLKRNMSSLYCYFILGFTDWWLPREEVAGVDSLTPCSDLRCSHCITVHRSIESLVCENQPKPWEAYFTNADDRMQRV